jgi:hypothetical protein
MEWIGMDVEDDRKFIMKPEQGMKASGEEIEGNKLTTEESPPVAIEKAWKLKKKPM